MKTNKKRSRMLLTVPAIVAVFLAGATICSHTTAKLSQEEETIMPQTVPVLTDLSDLSYTNDLGITDIGDPFMLKVSDDSYYLYCTSAPNGFLCWKSSDMVHWSERKMCYTQEEDSWGRECFWAPEVVYYENTYYMLYTARNAAGRLLLGLAVSEDPAGPFKDIKNEPLFDPGYAVIDGNLLFAPDGSKYLYFSRDCSENTDGVIQKSELYAVRLSDDLTSLAGEPVKQTTPSQKWEKASVNPLWNEGPEILVHNGLYYLTYSGDCTTSRGYSVGYATSQNPLGPFEKYEKNPVLTSGASKNVSGPGHHSFTESPDGKESWTSYHTNTDPINPGVDRKVNIDRYTFTKDGILYVNGPTLTPQPNPSNDRHPNLSGQMTVTVNGISDSNMTDGIFSVHPKNREFDSVYQVSENGTVTIQVTFPEAVNISSVWIYPGVNGITSISGMKVFLDKDRCTEFIPSDCPDLYGASLHTAFEGQKASELTIELSPAEGVQEITLSEIMIFG